MRGFTASRVWKLVQNAIADEAICTYVKENTEHTARPVVETSTSRTASAARGSASKTKGGNELLEAERSFGEGSSTRAPIDKGQLLEL